MELSDAPGSEWIAFPPPYRVTARHSPGPDLWGSDHPTPPAPNPIRGVYSYIKAFSESSLGSLPFLANKTT